jgi:DivIVA domain-containing protein
MARKKDEGSVGGSGRLTPVDVQQIQFRRALRGYDEQEVDDFLDRITEELTLLIDERRSAAERAGSLPTVRVASAGDAAAASKQAEDLLQQARERADSIVREANQRAAATIREAESRAGAPGVAAAAGAGIGVSAFLAKEREFLQRLAALVQGHAEGVKTMVAANRDAGAAGAVAPTGPAPGSTSTGPSTAGPSSPGTSPAGPGDAGSPGAGTSSPGFPDSTPPGAAPGGPGGPTGSPSASAVDGPRAATGLGGAAVATATREADVPAVIPDEDRPTVSTPNGPPDATAGPALPALPPQPSELSKPIEGSTGVRERPAEVTPPEAVSGSTTASEPVTPPQAAGGDDAGKDGDEASLRELFWGED